VFCRFVPEKFIGTFISDGSFWVTSNTSGLREFEKYLVSFTTTAIFSGVSDFLNKAEANLTLGQQVF
jgi:H+/gluconate symporter-like permease